MYLLLLFLSSSTVLLTTSSPARTTQVHYLRDAAVNQIIVMDHGKITARGRYETTTPLGQALGARVREQDDRKKTTNVHVSAQSKTEMVRLPDPFATTAVLLERLDALVFDYSKGG